MKPTLCALTIFFLGLQSADAGLRLIPDDYKEAAKDYAEQVKTYNDDDRYKDKSFALPPRAGDSDPSFRIAKYSELDEYTKEIFRLKVGENLLIVLAKEQKLWAEDLTKAKRPVIFETEEQKTKRANKAAEILNGSAQLQATLKSHAAKFIRHVEKFVETNGDKASKMKVYSTKLKEWCKKEGITLPEDLQLPEESSEPTEPTDG